MAFYSGVTQVGTAPVAFVDPGIRGALIQNIGTVALALGSPTIAPNQGPVLAVGALPIWIYGAPVVGEMNTDFLHAVLNAGSGTATTGLIGWVVPVQAPSWPALPLQL